MSGGGPGRAALAASLLVAAGAAAATRVRANDLWWHLEAGEWIAAHGTVPRADDFTFTGAGIPWVDHGWLWQVAAFLLHAAAGIAGLHALKIACALIVAGAALGALRRAGLGPHASAAMVVLCLAGARFRIADRPDTASLSLLALFLFVTIDPSLRTGARALGAAAVCALWANVHAGVLLAPALALAAAAGSFAEGLRARRRGGGGGDALPARARAEALAALAAAAALLANPYGWRLLAVPGRLRGALSDPRLVNPEWLPPSPAIFPLFFGALTGALALSALRAAGVGGPRAWRPLLWIAAAGGLALSSARHVGVFFTVLPFAAAAAGPWRLEARRLLPSPPASLAPLWGLAAAAAFVLHAPPPAAPAGFGVEPGRFPEVEADYLEANVPPPRRLYNDVAHGGYLIWRFYPEDRAFVDGRNEVHARLLAELASSLDDGKTWSGLLDRHGIRAALVRYREERIQVAGRPAEETRSFSALHFPARTWALVAWGDAGMVFLRRGAGLDDLIARDEYRSVHPEDVEHQLRRCLEGDASLRKGILADLKRRIDSGPPSSRAEALFRRFGEGEGG